MRKEEVDWAVVYMTHRREKAEKAREVLESEGFVTCIHPEGQESASGAFEIKCLMSEAREARSVLTEKGFA